MKGKTVVWTLPESEAQLLLLVLQRADDLFNWQGNTDFDFETLVPNQEARRAFMERFERANGTPEEYEEAMARGGDFRVFSLSYAAFYLAGRFAETMYAARIEDRSALLED